MKTPAKRLLTMLLIAAGLLSPARAQDWAKERLEKSPRHGEWVSIPSEGRELKCFVVYPEVKDKAIAVLVVHEIFGLTDWVRGLCDQLAEAGYIAIAPDLLSGQNVSGEEAVRKAVSGLPAAQVTADLNACVGYLKKLPAANGKVAVAGFCWGGAQAFRFASETSEIQASFVFYGPGPDQEEVAARIQCPVYGFYAENDARVNTTIEASEKAMKKAGKTFDPATYAGAGHGFMRAGEAPDASLPNREAREQAWKRWKRLLAAL